MIWGTKSVRPLDRDKQGIGQKGEGIDGIIPRGWKKGRGKTGTLIVSGIDKKKKAPSSRARLIVWEKKKRQERAEKVKKKRDLLNERKALWEKEEVVLISQISI